MKLKKGAASFYVVAFSALILLIVVASFTALVIAQITRSSNDDLSQSAYDSALAGIEDAKLVYYNYKNCVSQGAKANSSIDFGDLNGGALSCEAIVTLVEKNYDNCDVVSTILGRTVVKDENGNSIGVSIDEVNGQNSNRMQQYYTCAKLHTSLPNYQTSLSSSNPMRAINVRIDDEGDPEHISIDKIEHIKVSWGYELSESDIALSNYSDGQVKYQKIDGDIKPANPPTLALAFAQAGNSFKMDDFKITNGNQSNRGTIFMTPIDVDGNMTPGVEKDTYKAAGFADGVNTISVGDVVKSNTETWQNKPFGVSCSNVGLGEFACSAVIDLPRPIGGTRADDNFIVAVMLPYGASTDVSLEFLCDETCGHIKTFCTKDDLECGADGTKEEPTPRINLKGIQIGIDSTGKANDLFRRVEARLEGTGSSALSVMGPLELFGEKGDSGDSDKGDALQKDYAVKCEYNFEPTAKLQPDGSRKCE